jgi:2-polyprenyl-3-methyl-5-hydroxy-6-metoxy-1,4-benzoquinol methylase/glycosyltransferase involved in cell wall biosynthesis
MAPIPAQIRQQNRKCFICGSPAEFECKKGFSLRESTCPSCGASRRQSDLAGIILETFLPGSDEPLNSAAKKLGHLSIFDTQSTGPVHDALCGLPQYMCSEFFDDVPPGQKNPDGVLCQDLQDLTFPSDYFDLVITQDVFEHIREPQKAFLEIRRVLKPGGFHIFTVPYHEGRQTAGRIVIENEKEIQKYPPVYHDDRLREQGALVFTDFGSDLSALLEKAGFDTESIPCGIWYSPSEIPNICDEKEYQEYIKNSNERNPLEYFTYNSWVFRSTKKSNFTGGKFMLEWTGERFLPYIDPAVCGAEIHYEHLHRYAFAAQFVKKKTVLDLASGEGYGSSLCAKNADFVVGVEIDPAAVRYATDTYGQDNLEFLVGSITEIPIKGRHIFDVIICYEAIEHIDGHDALLSEIKRLLKKDGILVLSTPNKTLYTDVLDNRNPFHKKELYFSEFNDLIKKYFAHVRFFGQSTLCGSSIFPFLEKKSCSCSEFLISKDKNAFSFQEEERKNPLYFIAIAADSEIKDSDLFKSYLVDESNTEISLLGNRIVENVAAIQSLNQQINEENLHIQAMTARVDALNLDIADKEQQISKFTKYAALYTAEIQRLNKVNDQLVAQYRTLHAQCNRLASENAAIKQGVVYSLTQKFDRVIINRLFPPDSKIKNYYVLFLKSGRILFHEGLGRLWWHYHERKKHLAMIKTQNAPVVRSAIAAPRPLLVQQEITTKVSVIIPTKNAGPDFRYTLEKIRQQKGISDIEIIIVDTGSSDDTLRTADHFDATITSIPPDQFNHGTTRNFGASHAHGEYVLFIVQDAMPAGDFWLHQLVSTIKKENVVAVSCRQIPKSDADLFACCGIWNHYRILDLTGDHVFCLKDDLLTYSFTERRRIAGLDDVCCLVKKDIFDKYRFHAKDYGEDLDLGVRLVRDGHCIAFLNSAGVIHSHNRKAAYFLKRGYVDNKNVFQILEYPPQIDFAVQEIRPLFYATATLYAALNASIQAMRSSPEPLNAQSIGSIKSSVTTYLDNPSVVSDHKTGCSSLDTFFEEMERLYGPPVYKKSDVLTTMFLAILDDLARYLQSIQYQNNNNDEFFDAVYKYFATVSGAFIAQYYLYAAQNDAVSADILQLDTFLREGI